MRNYLKRRARQYVVGFAPLRWRVFWFMCPLGLANWIFQEDR